MSENLFYYLEKNKIPEKDWDTIAQATAEWLRSRFQWEIFRDENSIRLLLTETAFKNCIGSENRGRNNNDCK